MSSASASRLWATISRHFSAIFSAACAHGDAADRQRARAVRAQAHRARRGVAVDDLDDARVDPEAVADDLREARLVALAVRRGAGEDRHRARRVHAHERRLVEADAEAEAARADGPRRRQAADLRVGREADPAQDPLLAQLRLLGAEGVHVDDLQRAVQRRLVVARVVRDAVRRLVGEVARRDEVLAPQLEGVHPQLLGELVDHDLEHVRHLRSARSADRVGEELVRQHPGDVGLDDGDRVAAGHHERPELGDHRRQQPEVGAEVLDDVRVEGGDLAVLLRAHAHVVDLVAAVV